MVTIAAELSETAARLRLAITRTARRLRQEALRAEPETELSPTLTAALATVQAHGPLTPSELAERERVQRPTATRVVGRLAELGLAERTADPADGRSALVSVTPAGQALLRRLRKRKNAYLAQQLRTLEAEEVAALERAAGILERLLIQEPRR